MSLPCSTAHLIGHTLCALQIPFVKRAPMVTFRKPIGSVSVSGHKFVGAPVPCGVVITRTRYIKALSSDVEYLNSRDATIMGSRNGHAPIYMWYTLTRKGYEGMRKDVEKCLRNAHLLKVRSPAKNAAQLCRAAYPLRRWTCLIPKNLNGDLVAQAMLESAGINSMLNELSSTVVFERPTEEAFIRKWQLACEGMVLSIKHLHACLSESTVQIVLTASGCCRKHCSCGGYAEHFHR